MCSLGDNSEAEWNAGREDSHAVQGESLLARAELYNRATGAARFHRASPDGQTTAVISLVLGAPQ
jgi:hypothetical protein